uniref:SUZ domain-containing protein n=1 Tax=Cacopsylla melanoneura TaxID=428564 RepID=A0A8D8V5U4_9HEMI
MVNMFKFCKNFNRKMDKAVKSITILKRTGSSNSSIGTKTEELLGGSPNIAKEDDAKLSGINEAISDISQNGTKEQIEPSVSNEEILDLSQKVSKEVIESGSNQEVLDFRQYVIKEEFKLSESSEIELNLIKYDTKKEIQSTQSNEEILDLSQKVSKEEIESGRNHEVLDFSQNVTKLTRSSEIEASKESIELSESNENVLNITEGDVNLPLEVKTITILKRPASCTSVNKNGAASLSPLENTNAVKNDCGDEIFEEKASDETSTQSKSSLFASGERKLHQEELKGSREVILKEETLEKPFTILKRPENAPNSSLIKEDKHDISYTCTVHVELIEKTHIENEHAKPCETTEYIENVEGVLGNEENKEEEPVQNFTILKRPEITNDKENKSAAQLTKTLEQRKREYDKARIRIFGEPGSYEEVTSEDEGDIEDKSPTIESHQESTSSPSKSPIPTSKSHKKKKSSPTLEQSNSSDAAAAPHVNEIRPDTPELYIETPKESLDNYNEIPSNTLVPCKEIPNHCSGIHKEISRNVPDIYNDVLAASSDLPFGIQNELPLAPLRSNGSQHPLHYYNQQPQLPLHYYNQPFYNGMNATSAYYCSGFDYNTQYGPFWSEGATNYPHLPTEAEVSSYGPPFNSFGTNFIMPPEELFYTYDNGYHIPDGVNDFSYDVHVDNYSSYDLSFTDFEGAGVLT